MPTAVITTINDFQNTLISKIKYPAIIVGDLKTNQETYCGFNYIEADYDSKLSRLLPFNHYARKNLGYIAVKKSDCIIDTDDDTFPSKDIFSWKNFKRDIVTSPATPNVLRLFTDQKIWPRGFPLEEINNKQAIEARPTNLEPSVVQSLVAGNPDVDAIWRLTREQKVQFADNKCFVLDNNVFTQGNTQATLWIDPSIYYLLYIPSTVSFRFCDILKMYVAQRCLWELGKNMAVCSPIFHQERNQHNLLDDFNSEISMYLQTSKLIDILQSIKLEGKKEDLLTVYEELCKNNIVDSSELDILSEWLSSM